VLTATSSKILVTIEKIKLFFVFNFLKIHFSFPQEKKIGSGCYVIPVIPYFFGNFQSVGPFRNNTPSLANQPHLIHNNNDTSIVNVNTLKNIYFKLNQQVADNPCNHF